MQVGFNLAPNVGFVNAAAATASLTAGGVGHTRLMVLAGG